MNETPSRPSIITSDPKVLHKIKFMQLRKQLIPLISVILLMIINIFLTIKVILYLSIACFGWYLLEKMFFRTKNKIRTPEQGTFVSPVDGKVLSIRRSPDFNLLTIKKAMFDVVELRLPYPDMQSVTDGNWSFETPGGLVNLKIVSDKAKYFENDNIHGSVIGVIPGNAVINIYIPAELKILVRASQNVFGGETELFSLTEKEDTEPKSYLVEEPIDEMD